MLATAMRRIGGGAPGAEDASLWLTGPRERSSEHPGCPVQEGRGLYGPLQTRDAARAGRGSGPPSFDEQMEARSLGSPERPSSGVRSEPRGVDDDLGGRQR